MSILSQLSSQMHDRTEASNRKVVMQCLANPTLLDEIAAGMKSASTSPQAARLVYPHLSAALTQWEGKHAAHALPGLVQTARSWPEIREEIEVSLEPLLSSPKGVVRKAARDALKAIRG